MIKFQNVSKIYNGSHAAVKNLNLEIHSGEIFGFLGLNGAGKTTTIKMLMGITNATEGTITVNDINVAKEPLRAKKELGFVPDSPDSFLRLKGIEYINFMSDIYEVDPTLRKDRLEQLARDFDMSDVLGDRILSYSHGMRQKIVLMGALIHDPNVWVLDEPMTGLDPKSSYLLKEMMRKHTDQGNTVFFSTHVLDVAEKICDRVGIINKGELLFVGDVKDLRNKLGENESLEQMFLEMTENE